MFNKIKQYLDMGEYTCALEGCNEILKENLSDFDYAKANAYMALAYRALYRESLDSDHLYKALECVSKAAAINHKSRDWTRLRLAFKAIRSVVDVMEADMVLSMDIPESSFSLDS